MKTILAPFFAIALCLSLLAGCSSKKPIVGKWKNNEVQLEFTTDGKLIATAGTMTMNGTYSLPDDGHVKMTMDIGGTKQEKTLAYTIDGDTMTSEEGGKKDTMTRVK